MYPTPVHLLKSSLGPLDNEEEKEGRLGEEASTLSLWLVLEHGCSKLWSPCHPVLLLWPNLPTHTLLSPFTPASAIPSS